MERFLVVFLVLFLLVPSKALAALGGSVKLYNTTGYSVRDEAYKNDSVLARLLFSYRNDNGFYASTRFFTRYNFHEDEFSKIKNYNYAGFSKRLNENLALDTGIMTCLKFGCEVSGGKESFDITNIYLGASLYKNTYIYFYYRDDFLSTLAARYLVEAEHYFRTDTYTYGIGLWHLQPLKDGWKWDVTDKASQTIWASVSRVWGGVSYEAHVRAQTLKRGDWVLNSSTKPALDLMVTKPFKL